MTPPPEAREAAVCANPDCASCGQPLRLSQYLHGVGYCATLGCPLFYRDTAAPVQPAPAAPPPAAPPESVMRMLDESLRLAGQRIGRYVTDDEDAPVAAAPSGAREPTVDATLSALEDAMYYHLDQPLRGDFMSLTRAWREILTRGTP